MLSRESTAPDTVIICSNLITIVHCLSSCSGLNTPRISPRSAMFSSEWADAINTLIVVVSLRGELHVAVMTAERLPCTGIL